MPRNLKDNSLDKKINHLLLPPYIIKSVTIFEGLPANPPKLE